MYITGPYEGAPFGLSIVNPANAGPFDLGQRGRAREDRSRTRITRGADGHDATRRGPYAIPRILEGIPLQIKHVNVHGQPARNSCSTRRTATRWRSPGRSTSSEGASSAVVGAVPGDQLRELEVHAEIRGLDAAGRPAKRTGRALTVKLTYPRAPEGHQANIAKVKVDLPKQLPSRLTTLQKACTEAQFDANPAGCPAASIDRRRDGTTRRCSGPVDRPGVLRQPRRRGVPELIVVLKGDGVTVDLDGKTFINKAGVTSSTFKTVPDVPVGSFELKLPEGKYSALTANGESVRASRDRSEEDRCFKSTKISVTERKRRIGQEARSTREKAKKARAPRCAKGMNAARNIGPRRSSVHS